jgi:hypothetical protein
LFLISFKAKNNVFILLLHALAKNTNPKSHFSNIKNHISNFSGKGTIPAQAAGRQSPSNNRISGRQRTIPKLPDSRACSVQK